MRRESWRKKKSTKSANKRERRLMRSARLSKKNESSSLNRNARPISIETPITNSSVFVKTLSPTVMDWSQFNSTLTTAKRTLAKSSSGKSGRRNSRAELSWSFQRRANSMKRSSPNTKNQQRRKETRKKISPTISKQLIASKKSTSFPPQGQQKSTKP